MIKTGHILSMTTACLGILLSAANAQDNNTNSDETGLSDLRRLDGYYDDIRQKLPGGKAGATLDPGELEKSLKGVLQILSDSARNEANSVERQNAIGWGNTFRPASLRNRQPGFDGYEADGGKRDPFSLTARLWRKSQSGKGNDLDFVPGYDPEQQLPKMRLRGLMRQNNQKAALLEIEGIGVHVVREGDAVGLHQLGVNNVIKIRKFDGLSLVVETGSFGQIFIVR